MSAPTVETVVPELLTSLPVVPAPVAGPLLRALDLSPRLRVPAWVTDPHVRDDILDGFLEFPDDLHGEGA